jgi:6-phosphofructokinase 1
MRVGVLTGGGDCPGLNAVIRAVVARSAEHGVEVVGIRNGWEGLMDGHVQPLDRDDVRGILGRGGTILGTSRRDPYVHGNGYAGLRPTLERNGIDCVVVVGGDGTLRAALRLSEEGMPVVGVPKTIDNDLLATAFTFGFDSAVDCATDALDRLHTTAASHERVFVLEVMGRHAGWIALHAGIAGGGDVILVPEIQWTFESVCRKILEREQAGKKFTLIVVAEGAELPDGGFVGEHREGTQDKLGGIGEIVGREIERRLLRETRVVVLGHLQRGGAPTTFDRVLATQYGAHGVRLIVEGKLGQMICYSPPQMTSVPILQAVHRIREVDAHGAGVQAARALGISFGDNADVHPFDLQGYEATTIADIEQNASFAFGLAEAAAETALAD